MIDQVTAREMTLWGDNTYQLYQVLEAIARGIKRAEVKGAYSVDKATRACRRLANDTIKSYQKEFGRFSVNSETRGAIAQYFLNEALELSNEL